MEDKVKRMEELLGAKFESWNHDTLAKILTSEEALNTFTPELVVHILLTRKNEEIVDTLVPIKYGFDIRAIKAKIEEQLISMKEKSLPIEDYRKNVLELVKLDNPIFKVAVYLTQLASFGEDYDSSKDQADIVKAIVGVTKVMSSLKMDQGFQILTELLDLIFPLRELYFKKYKFDLIAENEDLKKIVDSINTRAKEMMEMIESIEKNQKEEGKEDKEG
jgi:hypothetical protein